MSANDGGPAFPCSNEQLTHGNPQAGDASPGMSLRDWFASHVAAAFITKGALKQIATEYPTWSDTERAAELARGAYIHADAMLKAREVSIPSGSTPGAVR